MAAKIEIEAFSRIVGADGVSTEASELRSYVTAAQGEQPTAILRPKTMKELREIILFARGQGTNLVFSSSAAPRFRGDSVPGEDGLIIDLSGMDRIERVERRNKVAYLEPGVTYERLIEQADKAGLKVLNPLLPRAGKSVIASYLEREPILIPKYHWEMTDPLLCTEIVLGTGDLYRTGTAGSPGTIDQQREKGLAHKNPLGPGALDFLKLVQGAQGTMGGVTWGTVKLEVKPVLHKFYFVTDSRLDRLIDFTYRAMRPRLGDEWLILNAATLAAVIGGDTDAVNDLAGRQAPWTLIYGVSGYKYYPEERLALQERDLGILAQQAGVVPVQEVPGCSARKMERILASISPEPYYKTVPGGAFRDIFFLATLDKVEGLLEVMLSECRDASFDTAGLGAYIQPIQQGRMAHVEFTLYYDPQDAAEAEKVEGLFSSASDNLDVAGAFFSRPYGEWSQIAYRNCPDSVVAMNRIKKMLDPDNILNRGKLCFGREVV